MYSAPVRPQQNSIAAVATPKNGGVERVPIGMSTLSRQRDRVDVGGIVGGASTQQMGDDFEQRTRADRQRLFLGAPTIPQALGAPAPLGPDADPHQGRHGERRAPGPGPALGQTPP